MYLSFVDEKPFYEELDFQSTYISQYLKSLCEDHPYQREEAYKRGGEKKEEKGEEKGENFADHRNLTSIHHLQNIIVTGPRSSGKSTQIYAFMASLFNTRAIYHLQNNLYENSFQYKSSLYHIEFTTKYFKNSDIIDDNNNKSKTKNIEFVRTIIETNNMILNIPKLLYIRDFDMCSQDMQKFFLRLIERSMTKVRFILEIRDLSKLSPAILSRFTVLRTENPPLERVREVLLRTIDKHNQQQTLEQNKVQNEEEKVKIMEHAILYSHISNFTYKPRTTYYHLKHIFGILAVYLSSLENPHMYQTYYIPTYMKRAIKIKNILLSITPETFFDQMIVIREILLELFVNNVSSAMIQKYISDTFREYFEDQPEVQSELSLFATKIDHDSAIANKDVFFTELLILFIMKRILFRKEEKEEEVKVEEVKTEEVKTEEVKVEVEKKKRGRKKKEVTL